MSISSLLPGVGVNGRLAAALFCGRQGGQALAEGLVAITLLGVFWLALGWLGRLQDIDLSTQHASSLAAFLSTRSPAIILDKAIKETSPLPASAQPGGDSDMAKALRVGWGLQDQGILTAQVEARSVHAVFGRQLPPALIRHTSILAGAGHASSDALAAERVAGSHPGWRRAADRSMRAGHTVRSAMRAVDHGWMRPLPRFDWVRPWSGRIPNDMRQRRPAADHAGVRRFSERVVRGRRGDVH